MVAVGRIVSAVVMGRHARKLYVGLGGLDGWRIGTVRMYVV